MLYNLQSYYETSAQNKKGLWYFLQVFLLICWYKSQSFAFLQDEFQFFPFDNFNSLLWGYYLFGLQLFLAVKLTVRIIGSGDIVEIKS